MFICKGCKTLLTNSVECIYCDIISHLDSKCLSGIGHLWSHGKLLDYINLPQLLLTKIFLLISALWRFRWRFLVIQNSQDAPISIYFSSKKLLTYSELTSRRVFDNISFIVSRATDLENKLCSNSIFSFQTEEIIIDEIVDRHDNIIISNIEKSSTSSDIDLVKIFFNSILPAGHHLFTIIKISRIGNKMNNRLRLICISMSS